MNTDLIEQIAFEQIRNISVKTDKAMARRNLDAMKCVADFGMTPAELATAKENNERFARELAELLN